MFLLLILGSKFKIESGCYNRILFKIPVRSAHIEHVFKTVNTCRLIPRITIPSGEIKNTFIVNHQTDSPMYLKYQAES